MKTYHAGNPPQDPAALPVFFRSELASIEQASNRANPKLSLVCLHVAPTKATAGDIVFADGADWNPGSGAGLYLRNAANTSWLCLDDQSAWTAYTPTVTSTTGAFTAVIGSGRYKKIGKTVHFRVVVTITTLGTAATSVDVTLPVTLWPTAERFTFVGRETTTGTMLFAWNAASATSIKITKYDSTFFGANGYVLTVSGSYEAA